MPPLVTVIIPSFNTAAWLSACLDSLIGQTFTEWEAILVDDGSTDNSINIANEFARKSEDRLRILHTSGRRGPACARNMGIREAEGRFIAFLDSDDLWYPDKLRLQIDHMRESGSALSCHAYEIIQEDGTPTNRVRKPPATTTYAELLKLNTIGCSTAMYNRDQCGIQEMPDIRRRQDHGLWLKLTKCGRAATGLSCNLGAYRLRRHSTSSNKMRAAWYEWQLLREVEQLPFLAATRAFSHYAWSHISGRTTETDISSDDLRFRPCATKLNGLPR